VFSLFLGLLDHVGDVRQDRHADSLKEYLSASSGSTQFDLSESIEHPRGKKKVTVTLDSVDKFQRNHPFSPTLHHDIP
jgi:hypothetical protein